MARSPLRRTLIFLSGDYGEYARTIVQAASVAAQKAGYGLVCVTGQELEVETPSGTERSVCNAVYQLVNRVDAAGVICDSGLLGHRAGSQAIVRMLADLKVPCVSLGVDVPGMPSVIADDTLGMVRLMEHLLADPRRQRLAFLRGRRKNLFSMEREAIFRQTLVAHGREIDESLFVSGKFDAFESYNVIERLLVRHPDLDAIVAANDTMALSAARAVVAAGLNIPRDVAVTGFDDVPDAMRLSPALSTVRQPLVQMAEVALAKLLESIGDDGPRCLDAPKAGTRLSCLRSEMVTRGSSARFNQRHVDVACFEAASLHTSLRDGMEGLKAPAGADLHRLADAIAGTVSNGSACLAGVLQSVATDIDHDNVHWWSNACHLIETLAGRLPSELADTRMPLLVAALAPVRERIWAAEMEREFKARRLERLRSVMQMQIGSSTGLDEILAGIDDWLRAVRPQRFYLIRYDNPGPLPDRSGRLLRASIDGSQWLVPEIDLDTATLLPGAFRAELERGTLVLAPVYAGTDHYGYLLIDPTGVDLSDLDSAARSIGNALRSHHMVDKLELQAQRLRQANVELSSLANRDGLTGLANRLCFDQRLDQACSSDERFALCFLDLDGFKPVNDRLGHAAGDALLQDVAARLEHVVQETLDGKGFVARLGGDEFTLLLQSDDLETDLQRAAAAVLIALSEPFLLEAGPVDVSASVGGAIFPDHGGDTSTLLRHADAAMYAAKAAGKNRFVIHEHDGAPARRAIG